MDSWENIPEMTESINVPTGLLEKFSKDFRANAKNILAMNAISRNDMTNVVVNRDCLLDTYHIFSDRLETEAKVANQKSSGRCWLFAATNILRLNVMKKYNLEEFEFSQAYLFWCDKLEKGNWFLENVLNTLDEELDGRLVQFILKDPVQDGGQWDMVVNLIEKFGLMPKGVFAESAHSGNSARLNWLITVKLREFACQLRGMHEKGQPLKELRTTKEKMLSEIYNIVTISLGEPPQTFEWSFRNKDKKFQSFKNLTPLTFYQEHVGEPIGDLVSLINDPRHEYEMLYTVQYLGNVAGGRPVLYLNLKIEELKKHTIDAIQSGKAGKMMNSL
jgi:bleomycin hydrolase